MKNYAKYKRVPLGTIHPMGWLKEQFVRNINGMGGHLDELEPHMIGTPYTTRETYEGWGKERKAGWGAEISGNYWTGLIQLAFTSGDPNMIAKADAWVEAVLKNQRPDGYLGTYTEEDDWFDDYNAWGTAFGMKALLAYYDATGREDVFQAVYRCMLWFCENWAGDRKTRYVGIAIIETMLTCYELTADQRLLDFCIDYYDYLDRNDLFGNSVRAKLSPELHYGTNHGAGYVNGLDHPALVYSYTGKDEFLKAAENTYDKLQKKFIQATGGVTCESEYLSPISSVAETEYCGMTFYQKSLLNLLRITGDLRYADEVERVFFNVAQGARKKDERAISYLTSPNQTLANDRSSYSGFPHQVYAPCVRVACCPVTSVRILPEFVRDMVMYEENGTLCYLYYAPSTFEHNGVKITLDTKYPFDDLLSFIVEGEKNNVSLKFRVPEWCSDPQLTINGKPVSAAIEDGFMIPDVTFNSGDRLELRFPMKVKVLHIDDSDRSKNYPIALKYGPLVFSLPVPTEWTAHPGNPATPLPEGWSWFDAAAIVPPSGLDVYDDIGMKKMLISWNVALDEAISEDEVTVERVNATGYAWEDPHIKLHLKAFKAPYSYAPYPYANMEPFTENGYSYVTDSVDIELVPYGCTNLRITYFPRAKTQKS